MRVRLPNRRESTITEVVYGNRRFHVCYSRGGDGEIKELFVHGHKTGTDSHSMFITICTAISIALQSGTTLKELLAACARKEDGTPSDPIGAIIEALVSEPTEWTTSPRLA